jgi:predicted nucleotidyltransferase
MSSLNYFSLKKDLSPKSLSEAEKFSVFYHNIFDFPLTFSELVKWKAGGISKVNCDTDFKNGFYFVKGRDGLIYKRAVRKRISQKKTESAQKAAKVISLIPYIKMVGLTGSLAMENADEKSDIDLIIITKKGHLWSSRFFVYLILKFMDFDIRKPKKSEQKDKLCLNMWLDESDLMWKKSDRNFYTAHEILQIIPLEERGDTLTLFLIKNKWVLDFWPNVTQIRENKISSYAKLNKLSFVENLFYSFQKIYMKPKITNETVTPTRAIFHPVDLSERINKKIHLTAGK